jgi:hypothetical protein
MNASELFLCGYSLDPSCLTKKGNPNYVGKMTGSKQNKNHYTITLADGKVVRARMML